MDPLRKIPLRAILQWTLPAVWVTLFWLLTVADYRSDAILNSAQSLH